MLLLHHQNDITGPNESFGFLHKPPCVTGWVLRGGGHSTKHTDTGHTGQKSKAGRKWYLCQRPRSSLYNKFCVAELTVTCVGGGQPFFQAALVHGAQSSCAVTRGKQSLPISTFVTDSTDGTITTEADRQTEGNHGQTGRPGNFSPPRQLQGSIIDPNLLTEPEIRSPGTSGHQRCPTGPVVGHPTAQCFLHPPMLTDLPNPAQPLLHEQQSPALSGHTSERTSPITFPAPPAPFAFLTIPSELQPSEPCSFQHFCSACALFCPSLLPKSQHCINFLVTAGAHTLLPHSCDLLPLNPPQCQARVSALHSHHSTLNQSLRALPARFSS